VSVLALFGASPWVSLLARGRGVGRWGRAAGAGGCGA